MSDYDTRRATRYLPHVVAATTAVVVLPVAVVWWLRSRGAVTSPWLGVVLAMALSLVASLVGSAYWKRRRGPRDLLFGELLVWGWLRRVRMERQLARSMDLLRADEPLGRGEGADRAFRILSQLAVALEAQDAYTDGHSRRVAAHAVMVARRLGLSSGEVSRVRAAAAVHDIGKVRVPADVLDKPGRLTPAEFDLVKRHADVGAEIVACLEDPELTAIVRHHHEHFDGTGYPCGLAGERIPLGARIIAVADTFDALTSVRPYRPAASHKRALDLLVQASGTQLDPVAVRAFLRSYSGNKAIVFWSLLTISPQRAVDSLADTSHVPRNVSLSPTATTVGAITAIAVTAIGTPIGPLPAASTARYVYPRAATATSVPSATGARRRTSPHSGYRLSALPASRRGRAARAIGRASAISPLAAGNARRGNGSAHSHPFGTRPGGRSSGGSPSGPTGRSGGGSAGGSTGGSAGGSGRGSSGGSSGASGRNRGRGPSTKDQCKNRGYVRYGFPNQGQCVAFVERGPR